MKALILVLLLPFINGDYSPLCPEGVEGCTEDNVCDSCNYDVDYLNWGDQWLTEGCLYCNMEADSGEPTFWCPWRCIQCEPGYELVKKEFRHYDIPDVWCSYTGATTTAAPECTAEPPEYKWTWSRSYSYTDQYWWIKLPAATFYSVGKCPGLNRTEKESEFSLVFSSLNGGVWVDCEGDDCDTLSSFGGAPAYTNRYSTSTDGGSIDLDVVQFTEDGTANIQGNDVEVSANSLKFGISMTDITTPITVCIDGWATTWEYGQDYDTVCDEEGGTDVIEVDADSCLYDKTIRMDINNDAKSVTLGDYQIYNDDTAICDGNDDINVNVTAESKQIFVNYGGGQSRTFATVEMCYSFPACASGSIAYDPFVYYEGDDADSGFEVVSIYCSNLTIFIATFTMLYHSIF